MPNYYMLVEFIGETLKELHNKGVSWGAVLTALLLWNKLLRNKEFKERDERVERNQQRIMAHLGVEGEWSIQRKTLLETALQSLRKWYYSLQAGIARVFQLRRGSKMNKAWLVTLVGYILAQLALKTGVVIPPEAANWTVDVILILISLLLAWWNRKKTPKEVPTNGSVILTEDNR